MEAALNVELDLPETGVCSVDLNSTAACCGSEVKPKMRVTKKANVGSCC